MRLSKIKTKEIRYVVWKYRLKRFLPHILTLCLAVIVAGGAFSAYSVYHKKHQKQLAKQSEVQREKDVNTARKKAQKEKTTLKPWYTYHSIAHAMGGLDGKDYLNINVNIKMYIFDHLRMYIFAILPLDRYIFLSDKIFL